MRTDLSYWKQTYLALNRWKKAGVLVFLAVVVLNFVLLALYVLVTWEIIDDIPSTRALAQVKTPVATELLDRDGRLLGRYYIENRSPLTTAEINDFYKNALIATEDVRFYRHGGLDPRSIFRVLFKTILLQRDASGGGSTITQQLAKNLYPRKDYLVLSTLINKFREMEIARRIEDVYEKEEILTLYSNTVSFGERAFGLHTAAHRFFNKHPRDLLLEEAATLVGMLKATSYYNPRNHPERAQNRRNVVLQQMAKYEFISRETCDQLSDLPLRLDYQAPSDATEQARYFKDQVRREFNEWSLGVSKPDGSKYDLNKDGLKIYATLNLDMQKKAETVMQKHMSRLQKIFLESWQGGELYGKGNRIIDDKIVSDPYYQRLREEGKDAEAALEPFITGKERTFWTWDGYETRVTTRIDSIKHYLTLLHTGIMAVRPGDGAILAWVGGNDFSAFQYDNIRGARQVGSTFKPIVYLTALQKGYQPCDMYENTLKTYPKYGDWTPGNADGQYGGKASLRGALTHSMNTVSVRVLFDAGIPSVIKMAKDLGISSEIPAVPSIVLGTPDVSLYEMVGVYATFANRGQKAGLHAIDRIEDRDGKVLFDINREESAKEQVVEPQYADLLNDMLLNVSVNGTARRLYQDYRIPFPICSKTGTTQNQSDGWYIAYNRDLAIGAWVGTMDRRIHFRNLGTGSGGRTALPMVGEILEWAARRGYMQQKKIQPVPESECPDIIPDYESLQQEIADLESEMQQIEKEIMGSYYDYHRRSSGFKSRKEWNQRYRKYKIAVNQLERERIKLKKELRSLDNLNPGQQ